MNPLSEHDTSHSIQETTIISYKQDKRFKTDISQIFTGLLLDGEDRLQASDNTLNNDNNSKAAILPFDLLVHCHGRIFRAHRLILAQNSQWFYDQLVNVGGKSEKNVPELDVTPMVHDSALFEKLLRYMYVGELPVRIQKERSPVDHPVISMSDPCSDGDQAVETAIVMDDLVQLLCASHRLGMEEVAQIVRAYMATFITFEDACEIIEHALKKKHYQLYEICVKIIEINADKVFCSDSTIFLDWSKQNMVYFLQSGNVALDELEIYHAAVRWCEHQCKMDNTLTLSRVFSELEPFIRYPFIGTVDLAEHVEPMGLVSDKYLIEAYKFSSLPASHREKYVDNFRTKARNGRSVPLFSFKRSSIPANLILSEDSLLVKNTVDYQTRSICADFTIDKPGVYYWEIECKGSVTDNNLMIMVGVSDPYTVNTNSFLSHHAKGWAIYLHTGDKYHNSHNERYCNGGFRSGTRIGVMIEMTKNSGNMYFSVDGKPKGLAFDNVTLGVCPCVSLYRKGESCLIIRNAKIPPLVVMKSGKGLS